MKRILVAKLRHHGDVLLASPLFSALKKEYPDAEIDAYIYKETLPMLEGHPAISNYILYDRAWKKLSKVRRYQNELKLLKQIRHSGYDLAINLTEGDRGALAAKASKAKIRIGFDPENSGMWGKNKCYTQTTRIYHGERHTVERHLDVLRCLNIFPKDDERDLTLHIPDSAKNLVPDHPYVLVHPVSRWLFKCLPPATIAGVLTHLHKQGEKIVLTSSPAPGEMKMIDDILSHCPDVPLTNLAGQTSLKELGALIDKTKLLFTVDSVPLHMASALKAPTLVVFGPTSEKTWAPWQNPHARVLFKEMSCRPCYMPGCGGSRRSDCLESFPLKRLLTEIDTLLPSYNSL